MMAGDVLRDYGADMSENEAETKPAKTDPPEYHDASKAPADDGRDPLAEFPQWVRILNLYKWPLAIMFACVIALIGYMVALKAAKDTASSAGRAVQDTIRNVKNAAAEVAERFHAGYITETFTSAIPELNSSGMKLELASLRSVETFRRSEAKTALWDSVYLGTTTTEIRVPVTYRYHLDLVGPWKLDVDGHVCIVEAPAFQPTQPPAIHTDRMQKWSERGWARFNETEQMNQLERNITPSIERFAADSKHKELVREECRKKVAEFVRDWLLREDQWNTDRFHTIKVIFADEKNFEPGQFAPTIRIKEPLPQR